MYGPTVKRGEVTSLIIFNNIAISWLHSPNGFQFNFLLCDGASQEYAGSWHPYICRSVFGILTFCLAKFDTSVVCHAVFILCRFSLKSSYVLAFSSWDKVWNFPWACFRLTPENHKPAVMLRVSEGGLSVGGMTFFYLCPQAFSRFLSPRFFYFFRAPFSALRAD